MGFQQTKRNKIKKPKKKTESTTRIKEDNLPSRFLAYPKGVLVRFSPYTFGEIKRIAKSTLTTKELFELILSGIFVSVKEEEISNTILTVQDFLFLSLMRKLASFGESKYTAISLCESCKEPVHLEFKITELDFKDITAPEFPVNAQLQHTAFEFSPMTVAEYLVKDEVKEELSKTEADVDDEILSFAVQVENMEYAEAYKLLTNCTAKELDVLRDIDTYLEHSLKPFPCKCKNEKCGYLNHIELDVEGVLIHPFRSESDPSSNGISFGKRS